MAETRRERLARLGAQKETREERLARLRQELNVEQPPTEPGGTLREDEIPQEETIDTPPADPISAFIRSAAKTATLGLSEKVGPQVLGRIRAIGPTTAEDEVARAKQEFAEREQALRSAFPKISSLGDISGFGTGLASGIAKGTASLSRKLIPKLSEKAVPRAVQRTGRAVVEGGLTTGAVEGTKAALGDADEDIDIARGLVEAAQSGAGGALGGGIFSPGAQITGGLLKKIGQRVQVKSLGARPSKKAHRNFKVEDIEELGVGGSLDDSIDKIANKFDELEERVDNLLDNSQTISVNDVINRVKSSVARRADEGKLSANKKEITKALDKWSKALRDDADEFGNIGLKKANNAKRSFGRRTSFDRIDPSPESSADKEMANEVYLEMMNVIQGKAPRIKEINEQFAKLIPIKNVVNDAQRVLNTRSLFTTPGVALGLAGAVGLEGESRQAKLGGVGGLLLGAGLLSRSPKAGSLLARGGRSLLAGSGLPQRFGVPAIERTESVRDVLR